MPCVIRKIVGDTFENYDELVMDEWRLREQVESLEEWLQVNHCILNTEFRWVADIGFCPRSNAFGGGPPITRNLMTLCLAANLEIYLSEYPGES